LFLRGDIRPTVAFLLSVLLLCALPTHGDTLDNKAAKAFGKIGLGPEQAEAFSTVHESFLKKRNMQMRRVLNSRSGEEVNVVAKKKARLSAKRAVKDMQGVLTDLQLKYYAEYLELANEVFLRDAGLR
jgi:hypothetical protein